MDMGSFIMGIIFVVFVLPFFQTSGKKRELPPANYTVEIKSYKQLFKSQASLERYESGLFKAGGYKWRLVFYPNGNRTDGGAGHISLYLKIDQCNGFPDNWSVHVNYKFLLQDKKNNTFLTVQNAEERRFDKNKKEWGFGKFLSLQTFNQPSNGFLINDSCVFGAEVFVIETTGKGETISVVKNPYQGYRTWTIEGFPELDGWSDECDVGDRKWRLRLYPKGTEAGDYKFLVISLALVDCSDRPRTKEVYANFKLRIVGRVRKNHWEQEYWKWFSTESSCFYDLQFIELETLLKGYNGYLKEDTLIIELQFLSISNVTVTGP